MSRVDIGERLSREVGGARVLTLESELEDYGRDESGHGPYPPDCAVLCESREEVQAVLRIASETGTPVTPRGAGSGKVGGCLPIRGGIVLSTERMQSIVEIDADDLVCVVEPGVITGELQSAALAEGLFYPPDPASLAFCSIGGNVACNAGGPRAFKYGVTREYVLGLEVALASGDSLRVGRRTSKGVTGYDLVAGFVGSEGTFGVSTEIVLKLLPNPPAVATMLAVFPKLSAAGTAIDALLRAGFRPRTLELIDETAIEYVRSSSRYRFPASAKAAALIELDGDAEGLEDTLIRAGQMCEQHGADEVLVAQDAAERRALWEARRSISTCLKAAFPHRVSEDICVPRGQMVEMIRRVEALGKTYGFPVACYGHAGDGNLHVSICCPEEPSDPAVKSRLERATVQLFHDTLALRGTLSGEHGIGLSKRDYMPLEQSEVVLEWQRKWKAMWDPDHVLNPGKILPPRPRGCSE